jgi:hypothetical protein
LNSTRAHASVSRPQAMLMGRKLIMTTLPAAAGRVRLSAYLGKRRLGTCVTATPAHRQFTCSVTLGAKVSLRAHISVLASLRIGARIVRSLRPAAPVAKFTMKMTGASAASAGAGAASLARYLCSPSMLASLGKKA